MVFRFSDFHNNWVVVIRASNEMMAKQKLSQYLRSFGKEHLADGEYPDLCCCDLSQKNVLFSSLDPADQPTNLWPEKVPVGVCAVPVNLNIFSE